MPNDKPSAARGGSLRRRLRGLVGGTPYRQEQTRTDPLADWARRQFAMPAPPRVKRSVLLRYGDAEGTWVETGTYRGDTTAFLARAARHVYSVEPGPDLAREARERFAGDSRVTIVEGLAEERLADVVEGIDAGPVSFWLDGHYSAGVTYRGPEDTPIRAELEVVERHLDRLGTVTVLVDDVRCFDPTNPDFAGYPSRGWLVDWAERNGLGWTIEHDIFAAWTRTPSP